LYHKDKEYVVKDGEVVIVDAFTGRLQPGRRWSEGLHQAIEAKEGVNIREESRTFASVTYQNYFRMYKALSGMTGTAHTSKEEFYKVYGLETYIIPTHRPIARKDHQDLIFQSEKGKIRAVAKKVKELNQKGQPVLVGTVSIEHNELLSDYLKNKGIKHEVLNAKNHEREGEQIAQAGKRGSVTVATNMAGRGIDIKLGGNPSTPEEYEEVKSLGGLFVLGTERHDARRIDNQLRGRSGRQGDPGDTQFFVSLEDSLMRIFAVDTIKSMMGRFNIPEDEPIENKLITNSLEKAQERIEGFNFDARKHVLEFDDVLNFQRKIIYDRRRDILLGDLEILKSYLATLGPEVAEKLGKMPLDKQEIVEALRRVVLQTIDLFWVDHLEMMEYLRSSVNLRAYGQRDPLVEYKRDGLRFFREMEASINKQIKEIVMSIDLEALLQVQVAPVISEQNTRDKNIGRNDPCPCGSNKKWKKCGMLNTEEHQKLMKLRRLPRQ
ncbi:MAG TPA: SEC-C metal-binding domain-containing protein, partial [Candidatus Paceibacterota bacterium]